MIATLMLILLSLVLIGILWAVITNLVQNRLDDTQSCFDIFEKVSVNEQYTCYNATTGYLQFSVSIADVNVGELLVSVSGNGQKRSFKIGRVSGAVPNVGPYLGTIGSDVVLPGENAGSTYLYDLAVAGFSGVPDKLEIAPIIDGNQCDVSDALDEIVYCTALG